MMISAELPARRRFPWNSGMFLFEPETLLTQFELRCRQSASKRWWRSEVPSGRGDVIRLGPGYEVAPSMPLDIAVMELHARTRSLHLATLVGLMLIVDRGLAPRATRRGRVRSSRFLRRALIHRKMIASGVKAVAIDGEDLAGWSRARKVC
ncbi:MAG: hypothetical protein IPL62_21270 [Caulobacteraceae bacterium]|nr:hypothetical protein [Caulobacteraceae bacterium]